MMQSIKEIADGLSISKQRVYRYIKQEKIKPKKVDGNRNLYSDKQAGKIIEHFAETASRKKSDDSLLRAQLKEKDAQIARLQQTLDQQQKLNLVAESNKRANKKLLLESRQTAKDLQAENDKLKEQVNRVEHASFWQRVFKSW